MIYSEVTGNGLPLVFIHGYGEDLSLWDGLKSILSKEYKVITLDLPGFGKSQPLASSFTLFNIAESVHEHVTESLKIEQFVIFGHSLGGYISLALTKSFPQSILAMGLINSTSFADSDEKKVNREKTVDFINKHGASLFLQSFVPNLFTPENQLKLKNDISRVLQMGANLPDSVLTSYMLAMCNRPDLSGILKKHDNVLVVAGLLDPHFSYKVILSEIGLLKQSENGHIFKNVAHMSMIEDKKKLATVIADFLNGI